MRTQCSAIQIGDGVELIRDTTPHRAGERGTVRSLTGSIKDEAVIRLHVQFDRAPPNTPTDTNPSTVKKL
jgi:hypothetical protein